MAEPVQRMPRNKRVIGAAEDVRVFGIRHLSPAGAYRLNAYLDEVQPTAVLVEGPSDANDLIRQITSKGVVPPIAMLAYTDELPIRTLLYPWAEYSPEYQAFLWAGRKGALCEFIDLPSSHALALHGIKLEDEHTSSLEARRAFAHHQRGIYDKITELAEEPDYESYWERYFEHSGSIGAYRDAISVFSGQLRELTEGEERVLLPQESAYNDVRESYMRRRIREALAAGHHPSKVVVVTGAYHALSLGYEGTAMTDEELASLPAAASRLTLMPYTYYKLSSRSGYGAGNEAPAYYQLFWECLQDGKLSELPKRYMSQLAVHMRENGTHRSTASVIEGVRMAEALASLRSGSQPTWRDLRDAAIVCLGGGELSVVAEALARTDIGTVIGRLPEGVSQTPLQDDLNRELRRLKLEKYKSPVAQSLELDLRENRRVASEEAAYLDLNRSTFLHRLELLGMDFARKGSVRQDAATWAEHWTLQWSPQTEIQAVESTLKGETIEIAASYVIHERLQNCTDIVEAARLIRAASLCGLQKAIGEALRTLQMLAVDAGNFAQLAEAAFELSLLIRFSSVRKYDTSSFLPLLEQLFLSGALSLNEAANCNDDAAVAVLSAVQLLNTVAEEHYEQVNEALWIQELRRLAERDDRNPKLSGFSFAILLDRNCYSTEDIEREVSRRLSPGTPADLGAGWFEGLSQSNRYALLSRSALWEQLHAYIDSLEEEQFRRSLLYLRRAFSTFEPRQRAAVAELLGEIWRAEDGTDADEANELLQQPLSEAEKSMLDELNDFDFGDL